MKDMMNDVHVHIMHICNLIMKAHVYVIYLEVIAYTSFPKLPESTSFRKSAKVNRNTHV